MEGAVGPGNRRSAMTKRIPHTKGLEGMTGKTLSVGIETVQYNFSKNLLMRKMIVLVNK